MEEDYAFVKIQTLSGHVHPQTVRVVTIKPERAGKMRHCYLQPGWQNSSCTVCWCNAAFCVHMTVLQAQEHTFHHASFTFPCDAGALSACVAPLFSQRPDIHQWMHHYTQLAVNKFYMYVPTLHFHEAQHYDAPHEVSSLPGG